MIKNILEMLTYVEGGSELIDIAKGKYEAPETMKEAINKRKRFNIKY